MTTLLLVLACLSANFIILLNTQPSLRTLRASLDESKFNLAVNKTFPLMVRTKFTFSVLPYNFLLVQNGISLYNSVL